MLACGDVGEEAFPHGSVGHSLVSIPAPHRGEGWTPWAYKYEGLEDSFFTRLSCSHFVVVAAVLGGFLEVCGLRALRRLRAWRRLCCLPSHIYVKKVATAVAEQAC